MLKEIIIKSSFQSLKIFYVYIVVIFIPYHIISEEKMKYFLNVICLNREIKNDKE